MKLNDRLIAELKAALTEQPEPNAVIAFVISDSEDDEEQKIKIIANIPKGSAPEVRQLVAETMDRVVEADEPRGSADMAFEDKLALSLCETFADELPDKQQALWDFNEDALDLCDALVSANLCRDAVHDWYWAFRSFMENKPIEHTPGLASFIARGPENCGQEIAALWTVAICHLTHVDHNDPPSAISDGLDDTATRYVANFISALADHAAERH